MQADPIGLDGGINPYAYVDNDPLAFIDIEGSSKTRGQANPGGNDPAVSGVGKHSTKEEVDAAIKRAEQVLKDPNASKERKAFLRGWKKIAKRGFTKSFCPPLVEDVAEQAAREACLQGAPGACEAYRLMGGEIDDGTSQ